MRSMVSGENCGRPRLPSGKYRATNATKSAQGTRHDLLHLVEELPAPSSLGCHSQAQAVLLQNPCIDKYALPTRGRRPLLQQAAGALRRC
jgi:hypothetical protein